MTSKELLYVEDALGHEKYFQTKCNEAAQQIQDETLKQCVMQMAETPPAVPDILRTAVACVPIKWRKQKWTTKT